MFAASRRSGARSRPVESNENSLGTPADSLPTRSPRSPLISIQDPSRNPSDAPTGSATSDPKKCLGDIPMKAPRSVQSLTARGSPRVSHGNGVHTALVRERGCSSRVLSAAAEVRSSVPVEVPYFEPHDEPSFWNDHNVQVLIRIRPLSGMEVAIQGYKRCLVQESSQTLTWAEHPETRFTFDHVACESMSQEKLFKVVGLPMVENCMSGYNSCMFAYGQTGSGKTYTMMGEIHEMDSGLSEDRGITPRIFEYLFTRIREEEEIRSGEQLKYSCKCSFLEIYNEQITDLLQPSPTNLQLREDLNKGVYVENLKEHEVSSVKDVFELLLQGAANRKIAATHMNSESSRSHSVFTCIIESRWEKDSMTHLRFGRLNLVDLAGSERQKSSGAEGGRLKEAANINRSLSTLGLVIMTLVEIANGKHRHVPYRDSKLTFLLQDSLGGNSKTAIIANVSPSICSASETLSTLKFAQRAKLIQNNAKVNEDASGDVLALQQQIQKLKDQLTLLTKNQSIPTLLCYPSAILEQPNSGDFDNVSNSAPRGSPESFNNTGLLNKKMNYLEATLLGSLRREKVADATVRRLEADISHMNRLAHQRENDAHQMKRLLKFREEKLKRLELLVDDLISSDGYLMEENTALSEEIQLLRERIDRNPELTQFALENKRLLEQIRMFEDFYQQGEREKLLHEISHLRNQFLKFLDEKFAVPNGDSSQNVDAIRELDSCRRQLSACQEYNDRLTRELDSLCHQLKEYHDAPQTKSLGVDLNLAEGCSEDGIASCEQVNMTSHINTDPWMGDIVPSQLLNVQKELRDARILVKAMDLQQIRLTEELDTLKQENIRYFELLQGKVYDGTGAEGTDKLALDATLERTHKDHKESKTFDMHLQDNHASQLICKSEMKHIPDRFEADTAKTILYLQKELAELQQHVDLMKASQLPAKEDSFLSKTKYEELHNRFCILTQENDRLSNLVAIKDAEIGTLSDDWEKAIIELTSFLIDGWRSLEDASDCIGSVVHSFPRGNEWISGHVERAIEVFIEREKSIANLQKRLEDAQKMGLEMELKLNSLKGATLAITEVQQLENDQNSKELSHLSQLLGEKVSRVHELENIIKRKEDDLMEVEKSAKAANAVIRKLRAMSSVESFDLAAESMISELVNAEPLLRMDSDFPWCETKYAQNKDVDMSSKVLLPFPIEHNSVGNRKLKAEADLSYLRKIDIHVEMAKKMVMDSNVALCTLYTDTEKYFGSLLSDINSTYAAVKMLIGSLINDFRVANKEFKGLKEQRKISPPIMIGYSLFNAPDTSKSANNSTVVNIMIDRFRETCALLSSIQVGFNSLFGLCGDAIQDECEICPGTDLQHVHKSPRYGKSEQYEELSSPNSTLIRHMREESEQAMGSLREMHFQLSMLLDGSELRDVTGCPAGGLCSNELPAIGKNPSLSHTNHRRPSDQLAMMELCQILQTLEERLKEVDANCSETRQVLSHKLSYARHDAQEKSKPTDDLFMKFEEAQHIMEEAELVLNALLVANEDVKHERDCCKQANEELHKEKVALTEEVQRLEASNLSEARHFKSLQEQIQMSLTDILNIISTFQGTSQRANLVVGAELNANCSDIVSLGYEVLQCIRTSRSWLEDIMSDIVE